MHRSFALRMALLLMLTNRAASGAPANEKTQGASAYLELMDQSLIHSHDQMPAMSSSATHAAELVVAGGHLYSAGPQEEWVREGQGRASGLMCLRSLGDAT